MRRFAPIAAAILALTASVAHAARPVAFAETAPAGGTIVLPLATAAELDTRGTTLDPATRASVQRALASAAFDYKAKSLLSLRGLGGWDRILIVGTGATPLTAAEVQDVAGLAARETAKDKGAVALVAAGLAPAVPDAAVQLAVGAELGGYSFDVYKSGPKTTAQPPLTIVAPGAAAAQAAYARDGRALVDAISFTRDLITEPSNVRWPEVFVERTRAAFKGVDGARVTALDVPAMERLGMGAITGVGRGSIRPPRMLIVEYRGPGVEGAPIALVGKGITFDSGGISLKAPEGMWRMKTDMSGAAAVVGTALSLARAQAPVHVVAIAALAENMPSGAAIRPGDVLRAMNGKTMEVMSTDAEGRLVLADGVAYAQSKYKPAAIVDVATLTGAVGRALGDEYAGLFSRHDALAAQLSAAGKATGEPLWRLPLHPSYAEDLKSDIADLKNGAEGGNPGAGHGAHFIGAFVDPATPWAHLDIAAKAWSTTDAPTAPKGAVGYPVRLLDRFVRDFQPVPMGVGTGGY